MTTQSLLQLVGVNVRFSRTVVLENVDLYINRGEIVTLIGPNGSGKTTLVRVALGLQSVNSGEITSHGNLCVGYVPQHLQLDKTLPISVDRFLTLAGKFTHQQRKSVLSEVNALDIIDAPMQTISGGEARRVLLARALLRNPELLVLDEPTAGVDVTGQTRFYRLIRRIRDERHCGVLLVSHDLNLVMAATDRVVCLNKHVCCAGHPEEIAKHPEYLTLFGQELADDLAVYTHHHDHTHDLHGKVVKDDHSPHG